MTDMQKEKKYAKIALPLIVLAALIIAGIGAFTGISVVYTIGMVGLALALAAAAFSSWKRRRRAQGSTTAPSERSRSDRRDRAPER